MTIPSYRSVNTLKDDVSSHMKNMGDDDLGDTELEAISKKLAMDGCTKTVNSPVLLEVFQGRMEARANLALSKEDFFMGRETLQGRTGARANQALSKRGCCKVSWREMSPFKENDMQGTGFVDRKELAKSLGDTKFFSDDEIQAITKDNQEPEYPD